jgi:hypothetical protein
MQGTNGIQLKDISTTKTGNCADDQVLITKSEDELQMAAHRLNDIFKKCNLKISTSKTKYVGICGNNFRRLNIIIE